MAYEMKCCAGDEPRIDVSDDFINKNKLSINEEKAVEIFSGNSFFGFDKEVAADFLSFDKVKHIYKDEYVKLVESGEKEYKQIVDIKEAAQDFLDYMVFAWMKALDERGISASRSIQKLSAWMKILGRSDIADTLDDDDLYNPYGRPALRASCDKLDISYPDDL